MVLATHWSRSRYLLGAHLAAGAPLVEDLSGLAATGWLVTGCGGTATADTAIQSADGDDDEQGQSEEQQRPEQRLPAHYPHIVSHHDRSFRVCSVSLFRG